MPSRPENELPDRERPERTPVEELRDWEVVQQNETEQTQRLMVLGGYLYRNIGEHGIAMVFVPSERG